MINRPNNQKYNQSLASGLNSLGRLSLSLASFFVLENKMNAYVFQAALWCEDCIEKVKRDIKAPDNPDNEYSYDSDDYPKGPYADGGGESDSPAHCDCCQVFLENPLTTDGIEYVKQQIAYNADGCSTGIWADYYSDCID